VIYKGKFSIIILLGIRVRADYKPVLNVLKGKE
jgi:hypothetical protein